MKNNIKDMGMVLGIALLLIVSFYGWSSYETNYKITFIERKESPDGRTAVIFQMRGEPTNSPLNILPDSDRTKGTVIVERDGEKIKTEDFTVFNQGESLQTDNWEVTFYPGGVEIILKDMLYEGTADAGDKNGEGDVSQTAAEEGQHIVVYYDGTETFSGYREEEVISEIIERYDGKVSYLKKEDGRYYFQADGFEFSVSDDLQMTDDYEASYFDHLAEQFSYGHNRITEFEKSENENGETVYVPVIGFHGRQPGEAESFSNACCDLVEDLQETVGFEQIGYFGEDRRRYFDITPYLENYDRAKLYNAIYNSIEQDSLEEWRYYEEEAGNDTEISGNTSSMGVSDEMPEEWKDYGADCFYQKKDGTELRMVGVDRAAGSSYYVLLESENGVNTSVVNRDPYLGHGGGAKWIDFLEGEEIGFSCLSYSGGSKGALYRTEDGGKSFEEITWPSASRELPDGTLYNPFIMPDKVWEENGALYMLVGQGPDGDYYEDGVWVSGLYESKDMGKNWTYLQVTEVKDTRTW